MGLGLHLVYRVATCSRTVMGVSQGTLAATLWFFCLASAIATDIDERDGGYINILVSIEPEVPPDENIIRNLKALLESSSRFLHRATNGRVYFKSFVIEVPKYWPKRKVDRHLGATQFLNSDVRIVSSKSCGFQEPCTVTSQGCQEKGDYVFIPAEYLQHLGPLTAETNESAAYTFVHEWAHLRYGVFDEYGTRGDDSFPETYCVDGQVQLSACSENIPFTANLKNGSPCPTDEKCHFGEDCIVKPYIGHKTLAESSIMFMPHVKNLSYFCESTNKKRRLHNSAAPTKQNNMCGGASVLDVILKSDDFKDLADANPLKHVGVTFKEWQERADKPQKIVLTLDVSASMWDRGRIDFLKEAARHYIQTIPDGLRRLAIVTFSTKATVAHNMDIVNSTTRQGYINKVNALEPEGWTCIGCGLELALELLDAPFDPPHGSLILLITDGRENRPPFVASVMQKLEKSLIEVSSFAIGRGADEKLEVLAAATKGQSFCFPDGQPFNGVNMGVAFVTASASEVEPQWPVTVLQVKTNFTVRLNQDFTIDVGLAKNTMISIRLAGSTDGALKVGVTDPSRRNCAACEIVPYGDTTRVTLPDPVKTGTWTLHLERNSSDEVGACVSVFSQPTDNNTDPIRSKARMTNTLVRNNSLAIVIVDVTKGKKIVVNATVTAEITDLDGATTTLRPRDDGQEPDVYADDGKYTDYYNNIKESGRYILKAYVSGDNVNVSCRTACSASSNMPLIMQNNTTASSIDIRVSNESESLKQHFESQEKIDSTNLVEGTLEPGEARTHNIVTMSLPPEWAEVTEEYTRWNLKFAARTTNALNVTSELSDIAELDYFSHRKHTSAAPVPTRHTAPEGGNTAEYKDELHKSTTEDSDDDEKSTSNAPRWEPTRDPKATKGGKESTDGHSDEDNDDGTTSAAATQVILGLLLAAVVIVSAGLWALKRMENQREAVTAQKSATELTATTNLSVQ
ncbi:calcium-activated chloride channel regulator 1-like isoform X3 [Dermacentor andersoni]|uniref:calcium-activated chloride channel regulator 1-like isoform X3 n=1 Tax=Dermacentor andersoni TaxID=34620 RepID=UPI003B3B5021